MTRHHQLAATLETLEADLPDVRAVVLASRDGLAMASTLDAGEGSRIAAMAATVHAVGHRVTATADLGALEETVIRSDAMTFVVYDAGHAAVLAVLADGDCNLGLVHLEGRRAAAAAASLLTSPEPSTAATAGDGPRHLQAPPPPPPAPPTVRSDADRSMLSTPEPSPNGNAERDDDHERTPA